MWSKLWSVRRCKSGPEERVPFPHAPAKALIVTCILRFHARAGYLQHYEALLKELEDVSEADGSQAEPQDQYEVERVALSDRNHNLPSETGLRYPSLRVMSKHHLTTIRIMVTCSYMVVHTSTY